jgi:hypothetical protein
LDLTRRTRLAGDGYASRGNSAGHILGRQETPGKPTRLAGTMKHDPYYKYLAAIIAAGVLIALFDPTPLTAAPLDPPATASTTR